MQAAREWLADCEWRGIDSEDLLDEDLYPDDEIRSGVERHYPGGFAAFTEAEEGN